MTPGSERRGGATAQPDRGVGALRGAAGTGGVQPVRARLGSLAVPAGRPATALVVAVAVLLLAPSTLLQLGLRHFTAPWFHPNDSTYQIELAGDLLLDGRSPYSHDYRF